MRSWRAGLFLVVACLVRPSGALDFDDVKEVLHLPASSSSFVAAPCPPQVLQQYPSGWPEKLDVGIYWLGPDMTEEKAISGKSSRFYDPSAPTLIYMHGWTGAGDGSTVHCERPVTLTSCSQPPCAANQGLLKEPLGLPWLKAGWNVGIFRWDQLADEPCERDAEEKVWLDRNGDGLLWRSFPRNGSANYPVGRLVDSPSVTDMCVESVKEAMPGYAGPSVRFVGRAIGAQLALRCAAQLHEDEDPTAPQRVALLEPTFPVPEKLKLMEVLSSRSECKEARGNPSVQNFAIESSANYVSGLWKTKKVVTEVYWASSPAARGSFLDPLSGLGRQEALLVNFNPGWCGGFSNVGCVAAASPMLYFLGILAPPPILVPMSGNASSAGSASRQPPTGPPGSRCAVPSPTCSDAQLRALVEQQLQSGAPRRWDQVQGQATLTTSDDTFAFNGVYGAATPDATIEALVARDIVLQKRLEKFGWYIGVRDIDIYLGLLALFALAVLGGVLFAIFKHRRLHSIKDGSDSEEFTGEDYSDAETAGFMNS